MINSMFLLKIKISFILLLASLCLNIYAQDSNQPYTIVIDAGHGGKDPGNLNSKSEFKQEKDLNLLIANKLGGYIETYLGHKFKVIYTRKTDTFIELNDRIIIANDSKADYFISVHCNSSPRAASIGTETHINDLNSKTSLELAHQIEKQFSTRAGRISRGVKMKRDRLYNLMVLQYTNMPSVLVETGFMTNEREERYLNTERGQDITASAIFRAFRDYVTKKYNFQQRDALPVIAQEENVADTTTNSKEDVTTIEIPSGPVYRIQVFASTGPTSINNPEFKVLNMPVTEFKLESSSVIWYKYYVGAFSEKKDAKKALKEISKNERFKDSFIVRFE